LFLRNRLTPLRLLLAGIALFVGGFIYVAVFAGIPYQDSTPAMEAQWRFYNNVGDSLMLAGLALAAASILSWLLKRF
jgi:hypothetical protein